ncbi:ATP-binding cassette domain-containing protein [Falsirhodobacter sp. 20TX0035]|uniref:ATP-binding cassette domain-containing protein n=1 Tax=Falsirhodobacter sp. 20TX0035 TaxID=3022019 RepID=UPI00232A963A|nr:ATP-binding cassette domain-containing protein [Falsirhodobacter sp. 20TX0035]MDB6452601.1 ATP-binding cassette domain-containing protein [Falsirhodobacter sp. 20TX0035]
MPKIAAEGRAGSLRIIALLGILQGVALGLVAWATRGAFSALAAGMMPPPVVFAGLVSGGAAVAALHLRQRVRAERLGQSFAASLRRNLYAHIAGMSRSDLSARRMGHLSLRFVGDLSAAREWAGAGVAQSVSAVFVLLAAVAAFVLLVPALALAGLAPMAVFLLIAVVLAAGLGSRHRVLRRRRGRIAAAMMERVALAPELDLAARTSQELKQLDHQSRHLATAAVDRRRQIEVMRLLPHLGSVCGGGLILWTAARLRVPPAEAAAALAILSIIALPLRDLTGIWDRWCAWSVTRAACERLFASDSALRSIQPRGRAVPVQFDGRLAGGARASVDIPAGALAVLAGPPGSGKSALARVLAGQDRPAEGEVLYGPTAGTLPRILHVSSAPLVLKGSLRRALTIGISPRPDPKHIRKVARAYGLGPLLDRRGSTKTRILEGGQDLSLQEQLALGLARAALSKPDLVVIDHPAARGADDPMLLRLYDDCGATMLITKQEETFRVLVAAR